MENCLISLCIPTNGVLEWVLPVLESIYSQNVDLALFEVVVTDNGNNLEFSEAMQKCAEKYPNLIYKKTKAVQFLNQIEAFRLAEGAFIKFINHRMKLKPGSMIYLIEFARKHRNEKPGVFFTNNIGNGKQSSVVCKSFDEFVSKLSYFSSWSAGLACWKEDFNRIPIEKSYNFLFPHTDILFFERSKNNYIIDNKCLFEEIEVKNISKGKYNLFNAFGVEYLCIIYQLYRDKSIKLNTFLKIKEDNAAFLAELYYNFILLKKESSYDFNLYKENLNVFYSYKLIRTKAILYMGKRLIHKLFRIN